MANSGFSAPVNYWGDITGLTPKSSNARYDTSIATAPDAKGDVAAFDKINGVLNVEVEYAVTGNFGNTGNVLALGKVFSFVSGNSTLKFLLTNMIATTAAGSPPTVKISGVQVNNSDSTKRTYPISISITPRSKAQDVASALVLTGTNAAFSSIETVYSIDPVVQTVGGWPVVHDVTNGTITVNASIVRAGGGSSCDKSDGFDAFVSGDDSHPDAGYLTRTVTAYKYLSGTDA